MKLCSQIAILVVLNAIKLQLYSLNQKSRIFRSR